MSESGAVTLREFLEAKIQHERELRESGARHIDELRTILLEKIESDLRHGRELRAILLKEIERRLQSMNEWREQLAVERGTFVNRDLYDQKHAEIVQGLAETRAQLGNIGAARSTLNWLWGAALGLVALVIALVRLFLHH